MRLLYIALLSGSLLVTAACGSRGGQSEPSTISASELARRIEAGNAPIVLDVRSPEEFAQGHIPGAINVSHDELPERIDELPFGKAQEVVVHCKSGRRAQIAEAALRESGHSNIRDLEGHWAAWEAAGLPTE